MIGHCRLGGTYSARNGASERVDAERVCARLSSLPQLIALDQITPNPGSNRVIDERSSSDISVRSALAKHTLELSIL
jgi:hypothetical protein